MKNPKVNPTLRLVLLGVARLMEQCQGKKGSIGCGVYRWR
jgi:hypothetical protein